MISIDDTVGQVRRELDEVTLSGNLAVFETDFEDLFSSEFNDDDLRSRVLDGARYVSARVRARYQQENIRTLLDTATGEIKLSEDRIVDDPVGDDVNPFLRLLSTRVEAVDGGGAIQKYDAQRRTLLGNEKIEDTGRAATATEPAYAYQDYEFVFEQGGGSNGVEADSVDLLQPTNVSYDGVSYTWNDGGTSEVPLPETLQEAVAQYVIYSCFLTLGEPDLAKVARQRMITEMRPYVLPGVFGDVRTDDNNDDS